MGTKIASLFAEIGADTTKFKRGMTETKTGLQKTQAGFKQIAIAAGVAIAAVTAIGVAAKKAFEFGKQGAELEFTAKKFDRLAISIGTTADVLMGDLKEATGGLISDMDLMAQASDFMALGLVKDREEAIRLTNVAGQLGFDMNQLVLTMTNMTTMRFDALGVRVDGFKDKVKALEETGLSASDAFKEAFLQQAEEQLKTVGSIIDEDIASFMKLEATIANLGDTLKRQVAPAIVPVVEGLNDLILYNGLVDDAVRRFIITEKEAYVIQMRLNGGVITHAEAAEILTEKIAKATLSLASQNERMDRMDGLLPPLIEKTEELALSEDELALAAEEAAKNVALLNDENERAKKAAEDAEAAIRAEAIAFWDLVEATSAATTDIDFAKLAMGRLTALLDAELISIEEFDEGMYELGKTAETVTDAGLAGGKAWREYDELLAGSDGAITAARLLEILNAETEDGVYAYGDLEIAAKNAGEVVVNQADKMSMASQEMNVTTIQGLDGDFYKIYQMAPRAAGQVKEAAEDMTDAANNLDTGPFSEAAGALSVINSMPRDMNFHISATYTSSGEFADVFPSQGPTPAIPRPAPYIPPDPNRGATGLDMIVPPGFPGDSFPILATSGEHVEISPSGRRGGGSGSGGDTVVIIQLDSDNIFSKRIGRELGHQNVRVRA